MTRLGWDVTVVTTIHKTLVDQLVCRDTLRLRYSRLQVEKVTLKLGTAELHVGRMCMVLRQHGFETDIRKLVVVRVGDYRAITEWIQKLIISAQKS